MPTDLPTLAPSAAALTKRQRIRAFFDMWLVDHGFIRDIYCNIHPITSDMWRAAQPAPHHLRWAKHRGIRTILNLRGRRDTCGSYILERDACQRLGLTLVDFPIRSRSPLDKETLHAAGELFATLEHPVLMHCKSGADRTGLMATLYLYLHCGVPLRKAMEKQLSLAYGHIRQAKTGVIDFFFERYLAAAEQHALSFYEWVDTMYDPRRLEADFRENWAAGILVNQLLRRE